MAHVEQGYDPKGIADYCDLQVEVIKGGETDISRPDPFPSFVICKCGLLRSGGETDIPKPDLPLANNSII